MGDFEQKEISAACSNTSEKRTVLESVAIATDAGQPEQEDFLPVQIRSEQEKKSATEVFRSLVNASNCANREEGNAPISYIVLSAALKSKLEQ